MQPHDTTSHSHKFIDLTGQRFGRLIVIRYVGTIKTHRSWECLCDCGKVCILPGARLRTGNTRSCGCLRIEELVNRSTQHGLCHSSEHATWSHMLSRCNNPNNKDYAHYGGRGITVCERWHSFENFHADMGPRPTPKHTLDRIDNELGYFPDNCRWATRLVQGGNTRKVLRITFHGQTHTIREWSEITGISCGNLRSRLQHKWSIERTLTTPVKNAKAQS